MDSPLKNTIQIKPCGWEEFLRLATRTQATGEPNKSWSYPRLVLYRGHTSPEWPLSSTMERHLRLPASSVSSEGDTNLHLRKLNGVEWYREECGFALDRFLKNANGYGELDKCENNLDKWLLGRHFGLASPYLDWTFSPFVAAFFALSTFVDQMSGLRSAYHTMPDGVMSVWQLNVWDSEKWPDDVEFIVPNSRIGSRARAQQCAFTKLESKNEIDLMTFLESKNCAHWLMRYDIEMSDASMALKDLQLMNINYLNLFPDMTGAALDANVQYRFIWHNDHLQAVAKGRSD